MTPLEQAVAILKAGNYRDAQHPFGIGSTSFSFDAVLTTDKSLDLVILQDTTIGSADRMRRELMAFGRSLDVIGSRRTLTLVLIGQRLDSEILDGLAANLPRVVCGAEPERQAIARVACRAPAAVPTHGNRSSGGLEL